MTTNMNIEKSSLSVFFFLAHKFYSRGDFVEALIECLGRVCLVTCTAKAWSKVLARGDSGPAIIHISMDVLRNRNVLFMGQRHRCLNGMEHPNLRHRNHEGKTDWPRVVRAMVPLVEYEVSGAEAE